MRGGYVHNHVLLDPLEAFLKAQGARTVREHPAGHGRRAGYIDLVAFLGLVTIAIEAELTMNRIANDLAKAAGIGADHLLIVVPNRQLVRSIRHRLTGERADSQDAKPRIYVDTLDPVLARLAELLTVDVRSECHPDINQ